MGVAEYRRIARRKTLIAGFIDQRIVVGNVRIMVAVPLDRKLRRYGGSLKQVVVSQHQTLKPTPTSMEDFDR